MHAVSYTDGDTTGDGWVFQLRFANTITRHSLHTICAAAQQAMRCWHGRSIQTLGRGRQQAGVSDNEEVQQPGSNTVVFFFPFTLHFDGRVGHSKANWCHPVTQTSTM
jgi:hypothetical protein